MRIAFRIFTKLLVLVHGFCVTSWVWGSTFTALVDPLVFAPSQDDASLLELTLCNLADVAGSFEQL